MCAAAETTQSETTYLWFRSSDRAIFYPIGTNRLCELSTTIREMAYGAAASELPASELVATSARIMDLADEAMGVDVDYIPSQINLNRLCAGEPLDIEEISPEEFLTLVQLADHYQVESLFTSLEEWGKVRTPDLIRFLQDADQLATLFEYNALMDPRGALPETHQTLVAYLLEEAMFSWTVSRQDTCPYVRVIREHGRCLEQADLTTNPVNVTDESFKFVIESCPNLRKLHCHTSLLSPSEALALIGELSHLRELHMERLGLTEAFSWAPIVTLPNLVRLSLSDCFVPDGIKWPYLTSFRRSNILGVQTISHCLSRLCRPNSRLRELGLISIPMSFRNVDLESIASTPLERVSVRVNRQTQAIFTAVATLRQIELLRDSSIDSTRPLFSGNTGLERLVIERSQVSDWHAFMRDIGQCLSLRHLTIQTDATLDLTELGNLRQLEELKLEAPITQQAQLDLIGTLTALRLVCIRLSAAEGLDLSALDRLEELEELELGTEVSAQLLSLPALPSLRKLTLYNKQLSDEAAAHLATYSLEALSLGGSNTATALSTETVKSIATIPTLRSLRICNTPLQDKLEALSDAHHLTSLSLIRCSLTDRELEQVGALTNLRDLKLVDNQLTEDASYNLSELHRLRSLTLLVRDDTNSDEYTTGVSGLLGLRRLQAITLPAQHVDPNEFALLLEYCPMIRTVHLTSKSLTTIGISPLIKCAALYPHTDTRILLMPTSYRAPLEFRLEHFGGSHAEDEPERLHDGP